MDSSLKSKPLEAWSAVDMRALLDAPEAEQAAALIKLNQALQLLNAQERIEWAFKYLPGNHVLSSSFGIQAAVMLSLVTTVEAKTPIVLTDTGYLFAETYRFIDELVERLSLDLKIYRSEQTAAWQEARYGQLWQQGLEGLALYNRINKVEPMQRALAEQQVGTWFAGLRHVQASSRERLPILAIHGRRYKMLPIVEWTNKTVHEYLTSNDLPYHPLWEQGYVSVGDTHSSQPLSLGMSEEDTRFNGLKRECGLHDEI